MGTSVAGYVVLLSCYNQVHELALLLHKDVLALNDHKYIAHQVALLVLPYVSGFLPTTLRHCMVRPSRLFCCV